jgi:two-component system, NarL family, sensor kinase
VLELDAARNRLDDPKAAEGALRELREETQEAIAEVRRLVYELRPPALDELGLFGAVSEQAAHLGGDAGGRNLDVAVDVSGEIPAMSAATEVAAYRIATEAMTNVARHADARHCRVSFGRDAERLEIRINDDGCGLDGTRAGVGLTSMRERASELGGSCSARTQLGGGTAVRASLPLTPA